MAEVSAGLAVAGWFVGPLISKLVLKCWDVFKDGMNGKLVNLQNITVPQIKQVIEKAEMLGREDDKQLMMVWMRELQDAAYEADNILDEYDYELLERQSAKGIFSKAVVSLRLSNLCDASFRSKLKKSLEKLDKIASRVNTFINMPDGSVANASSSQDDDDNRVAGSVPTEPRIFGRDAERDHIVNLLTNNHVVPSESDDHLQMDVPILPIVGVGGVGKTTFAQYVYNNTKISKHFLKRMWIDMPHNFDEIVITRRMVELVNQDACPTTDNITLLQRRLQEGLDEKRFLLVLDDVRYDEEQTEFVNRERWRKLLAPLRHRVQGSVVLITSRIDLVAMTFSNTMQPMIRLEGLKEDDCLSLFNRYAFEPAAFGDQQRYSHENDHRLMGIGKEIARKIVSKLGGLPLAAKVLGGMLRNKHDVQEWDKVLRMDILDDITRVLTLSYKRLSPLLQQCVVHHGLYPKGFLFKREFLVRAWIAEGFISAPQDGQNSGKSLEDIGIECLNNLVFRSFLQQTQDGRYMAHDLMYDVIDSVSKHVCTRIQKGDEKKDIPLTTKHLFIHMEDLDQHKKNICQLKNLRTLFVVRNPKSIFTLDHRVLHKILNKSKRLRTLRLCACYIEKLPDSIGGLKHLRLLELSESTVKTLPKSFHRLFFIKTKISFHRLFFIKTKISFHRLYHLMYLDLSKCKFDSMPKGLSKLVNLRQLKADGTTLSVIPNLGRLTELQELKA